MNRYAGAGLGHRVADLSAIAVAPGVARRMGKLKDGTRRWSRKSKAKVPVGAPAFRL